MRHLRLIMILFFVSVFSLGLFLWVDRGNANDNSYKCFADTYPDLANKKNIFRLGSSGIINEYVVKPLAESKHPNYYQWFQWIDTVEVGGKLDGICDFVVLISVNEADEITLKLYPCAQATDEVLRTADVMGIDPKTLLHFASDVVKNEV